jgi:hypothetical protein
MTIDKEQEFQELIDALDATPPKSTGVDGNHAYKLRQVLRERGYTKKERVNFKPGYGLNGEIFWHPQTKVEIEVSTGNFMGSFTQMTVL